MILQIDETQNKQDILEKIFTEIDDNYPKNKIVCLEEVYCGDYKKYYYIKDKLCDNHGVHYFLIKIGTAELSIISKKIKNEFKLKGKELEDTLDKIIHRDDEEECYRISTTNEVEYFEERLRDTREKIVDATTKNDSDRITAIQEQYYKIRKVEEEIKQIRNIIVSTVIFTFCCIIIDLLLKYLK